MRGSKPIPTAMKVLRGQPGHHPLNANEPKPEIVAADLAPPAWLTDDVRAEWVERAPMLQRNGLLTEADLDAFGLLCQLIARWKEAESHLATEGMVYEFKTGYRSTSPWLQVANKAQAQAMKMMIEFGMTPSARSRVTVSKNPGAAADTQKARFFGTGSQTKTG